MKRRIVPALLLSALALSALPGRADAQFSGELRAREDRSSREMFIFEFSVGTYTPRVQTVGGTSAIEAVFDGDQGPMLHLEVDIAPFRIPYVGLLGAGVALGWSRYSAPLCANDSCTQQLDEEANLRLWPVSPQAVLRVDTLAREFNIPFVFTGKLGMDIVFYTASGGTEGSGSSVGFRWALQAALELDFIDRQRANVLDDEFGINHTTLFFELYGSNANSTLDLGTDIAWAAGLGMTF